MKEAPKVTLMVGRAGLYDGIDLIREGMSGRSPALAHLMILVEERANAALTDEEYRERCELLLSKTAKSFWQGLYQRGLAKGGELCIWDEDPADDLCPAHLFVGYALRAWPKAFCGWAPSAPATPHTSRETSEA